MKIYESLCTQTPYAEFRSAALRLSGAWDDVHIHEKCRINFRTRLPRKEAQPSKPLATSFNTIDEPVAAPSYRVPRGSLRKKQICFVCNEETKDDNKQCDSGGFGRYSEPNAVSNIQRSRELKIKEEGNKFHDAAKRLEVILSGASYDVFAANVYYHKTYDNFTYPYDRKLPFTDAAEKDTLATEVMNNFFSNFLTVW